MNNPEKPKSQEWLKNDEERNRRLDQLGLSKNQNYSDLSQEEKQFLDMDYKSRQFIEDSLSSFIYNHDDISYEEGKPLYANWVASSGDMQTSRFIQITSCTLATTMQRMMVGEEIITVIGAPVH
jgi:hypothetical protein